MISSKGLKLNPSEAKEVCCARSFHVSQVAVDLNESSDTGTITQLWIRQEIECLLATLSWNIPQEKLDLAFAKNEKITFHSIGSAPIYLSGYYIPEENEEQECVEESEQVCRTLK